MTADCCYTTMTDDIGLHYDVDVDADFAVDDFGMDGVGLHQAWGNDGSA